MLVDLTNEPIESMTCIDQVHTSLNSRVTSSPLSPHYKKTLCQILPGGRRG